MRSSILTRFSGLLSLIVFFSLGAWAVNEYPYLLTPKLDAGNVRVTGNTLSTLNTNGDFTIAPNGTGATIFSTLSATTVPYLDASKKLTSSAITPTQLALLGTATNSNTPSTLVQRDGSGNFSAGTITASLTGNISGNAATVTTNANLTGPITSTGNSTTVASQTGTGSKFVMDTAPAINGANLIFGTASNTNMLQLPAAATATLAGLTNTAARLAYDSTLGKVVYNDGTGFIAVGTGASSGVNYTSALYPGASATGVNTYNDSSTTAPVDGSGGVVTGLTTTINASSPVQNPSNIRFSKDAANRQGMGWSFDFTLDRADFENGRPIPITFMQKTSAAYATGDLTMFVYDVSGSALVGATGIPCLSNSSGVSSLPASTTTFPVTCYFQPRNATDVNYRIIWHVASTNASAWDFDIARIKISPDDRLLVGPAGPVGEIIALGSATTPANFLPADGTAVSRTTYSELFGVIGTTYGVGDGSTTFNVPNGSGVFLRGTGTQTIGGIATPTITLGTASGDTMQGHVHILTMDIGVISNGSTTASAVFHNTLVLGTTALNGTFSPVGPTTDGSHGTPRIASETAPANLGVKFYVRYTSQSNVMSGTALTLQTPVPTMGSSSVKTPTASGNWNLMTGNSLTLTTGMWRLSGSCIFNASGTPAYSQTDCYWAGANGADTVTQPAAISNVTGVTPYAGLFENYTLLTSGTLGAQYPQAPVAVVKCAAPTCVVYLDTYSVETTPASARISVVPNAEKIPDFTIYGVITQSVISSNASGSDRIERARMETACSSTPCTLADSTPAISSVSRASTGNYSVNFVAGSFSAAPTCVVMSKSTAGVKTATNGTSTTSAFTFQTYTAAAALADDGWNIICMGQR